MNLYLLASAGGVSFLCLLAGLLPLEAMLAAEELVIDTQKLNPELGTSISISAKTGNPVGILQMQPNTWQTRGLTYNQSQVESTKAADSTQNSNQLEQPHSNLVFTTLPTSSSLDPHSSVPQLIVQQASNSNNTEGTDNSTPATMAQVTSVSQLSDVQLTDWAFQALQSLVERYGCIAGYPDGTYWGNRALTRYEFAAGLNACLDHVNELIATATNDLVSREDLATLQRLQAEFATELTTLRGRVDAVEAQTAELEANQFSPTTKLSGEVIAAGIGATGGAPGGNDANIIPLLSFSENICYF